MDWLAGRSGRVNTTLASSCNGLSEKNPLIIGRAGGPKIKGVFAQEVSPCIEYYISTPDGHGKKVKDAGAGYCLPQALATLVA